MRRIVIFFAGLLLVAGLVGCGSSRNRPGTVSGKVTYKGQPVGNAALLLYPPGVGPQADAITIPVDPDGTFSIRDVPTGEYKIVVQGTAGASEVHMDLKNIPPDKREEVKEKLARMATPATIKFPKKYQSLQTTDLKCTITNQNQSQDLELKD